MRGLGLGELLSILLVADLFQPIDHLTVELLLDGDMRHGRGRRGPVPMPHAWREPDHVTRTNLLDRAAFLLDPAAAGRDDEGLPQRVGMPRRPGAGFERDAGTGRACRSPRLEQGVDGNRVREPVRRSLTGRLRPDSRDVHLGLHKLRSNPFPRKVRRIAGMASPTPRNAGTSRGAGPLRRKVRRQATAEETAHDACGETKKVPKSRMTPLPP